ncbi:MAG TPA: outer membrane protein assembly factor BamA [Xanthobacteraceae bacterium]|nr:outer membrane protein assembly factor BamA [Xanthobacteraceae bacterium]
MAGLLLVVSVVGFASNAAFAAPAEHAGATEIVVEGNRRVDADTIRQYFKAEPGERLNADEINAGIKALYASGLFQNINVTTQGNRVIVSVVEAQVIDRVVFEGNHRMKDEQLQQEIQSKARGTLSKPAVQADTERIIEVYHRNGRFDVTVVPQIIDRPNNRVDLIFVINEGEKTGVKEIDFVGNHAYSSWRLKDVIKTEVSNFLSFLQTTDVYDPDRIEADRDLLRRFYLKHGYADVQVISATGVYDPARKGFIITFTIEEGPQYHFGKIDIQSNVRAVDAASLRSALLTQKGDIYNGDAVEKTVEDITIEMARRGYPFGTVRPRGDRNPQTRTIGVTYVVDEGTRAYIERINIIGNTRTRDYVIRRELDINEGDPYNRALLDRGERRIKNLNFFKDVKITTEPGSAPDRVVVNINVVEQSTGDFSIMGGYSTAQGWMVEASVSERNLLGTGRFAKASATYGEYVRAAELDYVEPYFLNDRIAAGIDLFAKQSLANNYFSYGTESVGGSLKFGIPLREDFSVQLRYSLYTQSIQLPSYLNDCNNIDPDNATTFPTFNAIYATGSPFGSYTSCYTYGQASLPIRAELGAGTTLTSSVGYGLVYNTLDNNKNPTSGVNINFGQDFAGVGGDEAYMRSVVDFHSYYEPVSDLIGILHLQAGDILGFQKCPTPNTCVSNDDYVRMLDDFKMGPNLVRGFAPAGLGPRDNTPGTSNDLVGGTMYWGASLEFDYPLYFMPKDSGFTGGVFVDSGSVWGYQGETQLPSTGEIYGAPVPGNPGFICQCGMQLADSPAVRASAGVSLIWNSPFGPLRFDLAYPFLKQSYDRTQFFAFGGGTHF